MTDVVASSGEPQSVDIFVFPISDNDFRPVWDYTIVTLRRVWLPSNSGALEDPADSTTLEFITDGAASPHPVISLADLRAQKEELEATLKAGEGIEGYAACIAGKLAHEQNRRANTWVAPQYEKVLSSGLAEGTEVYRRTDRERDATDYHNYWLSGDDMDLFQALRIDDDDDPKNGYDHTLETVRPLPTGVYRMRFNWQHYADIPCNYRPDDVYNQWTVSVTAPAGTLHEAFFDPVTLRQAQGRPSAVGADGTSGVLKPAAFTDASGGAATIHSISYEASSAGSGQGGTVEIEVTPNGVLAGHVVDFIELDGTVSLSLDVVDAEVNPSTGSGQAGTLSWSVSSEPWEDGDMLMVRIRGAR